VWTPREFQTIGVDAQNALAANNIGLIAAVEELKLSIEF